MTNFVQKYLELSGNCFVINAKDDFNFPVYYVVRVLPAKLALFKIALEKEAITPTDYGEVLCSGYGDYPPQSELDKLGV